MKIILKAFLILVVPLTIWAQKEESKTTTQGLMDRIFSNLAKLTKYSISEEEFQKKENEEIIKTTLKDTSESVQTAIKQHDLKKPLMQISGEVLSTQFRDAERAFNTGHKAYSRWMVNSSLSICMSCHTQVPKINQPFDSLFDMNNFKDKFDQAELRFVLRNYDKALPMYNGLINEYPGNKISVDKLETALKRKIAIFARIKRSPAEAIASLEKDYANKNIPPYLHKNIESWLALFRMWSKEKDPNISKATDKEILTFVEKQMKKQTWDKFQESSNPRAVSYLRVSGVLYDYLYSHPKTKIIPEILYYLAICDRELNNNFFYSLAELYLKECVMKYPTTRIAKKCFIQYEEIITSSFTGSAGTDIPEDVKQELKNMSEKIYKK